MSKQEQERALTRAAVEWIAATDALNAVYKELEEEGPSLDLTSDGDASYHHYLVHEPWQRATVAYDDLVAKTRRWIRDHRNGKGEQ